MPVRFILGRAGAGKTHWCFERICRTLRQTPLGPNIYWLLPRQATFQAERQLACQSGLGGYFRARIISFDELGKEILAECGAAAVPEITPLGRRMILGHLLRKLGPRLQFFQSVADQPGVAAELDDTFAELERAGHDAAAIQEKLGQSPSAPVAPSLSAKIHDLALIHSEYIRFLGQDRLDPNRRLAEALAAIDRCRSLREADVYIDSFLDFTGSERQMIAALAKVCRQVFITLTVDPGSPTIANPNHLPDELSLFHRSEEAYRRLWFAFHEEEIETLDPVILSQTRRFENAELASLERWDAPPSADGPHAIELIEAPDRRAEVDAAARWIRELTAGSLRYRDIALLMRSEEDYRELIEASFQEHGIPFFADRRRTASHHPLLRLIRAALAVANRNWPHEAMMAVLKTGLVGLSHTQADALENYVLLHGVRHGMWNSPEPWTGRRGRDDESNNAANPSDAPQIDELRRRVASRLQPFVQAITASHRLPLRVLAHAVFDLLEAFDCRQSIVRWMDDAAARGRLEEHGEHERVWDELVQLFEEMVDLFVQEPITLADLSAILDSALEGFDLALAPPTVDQVLVGPVDRTRTPPLKACIVLGLGEGQFPRSWREETVFSDLDRRTLGSRNIDLDPDTTRRLLNENFLGYLAFTRASQRLLLTRPIADDNGKSIAGSSLWRQVLDRFPGLPVVRVPREQELPMELIATPRQLVAALMRWVRTPDEQKDPIWAPLYQWLATHETRDNAVDIVRYLSWKALSHDNQGRLEPERAAAIFPSPLEATVAQIESFRACPYQHFARHGLRLAERQERDVTGADLSRVYHDVLERLVAGLIQAGHAWTDLDADQTRQRLGQLTAQLGQKLRDELMISTARNRYLLDRVEKTLASVAAAQKAAAGRGQFRPAWVNVRFGGDAALPPLEICTPAGHDVHLRGKIDRIDVLPDGSACVVDYRLGAAPLDTARIFHGLSLQLLSYLLVLEKNGRHLTGEGNLSPAAAFCVQLLREVKVQNPQDALPPDDPRFALLVKPRGLFDLRFARQLDGELATGSSDVVQIYIKKDGALGRSNSSDAIASEQFRALLHHIEHRIGELADGIIAGRIDIRPYRIGKATPCPTCEFRALCRLEPAPGCYDDLPAMQRDEMLQCVLTESQAKPR